MLTYRLIKIDRLSVNKRQFAFIDARRDSSGERIEHGGLVAARGDRVAGDCIVALIVRGLLLYGSRARVYGVANRIP